MRRLFLLGLVVAHVAVPSGTHAHKEQPTRKLVVQLDERGAVALWTLIVEGAQARLLRAVNDRDRDRRLTESERLTTAVALSRKAQSGVLLTWDGNPIVQESFEPRLRSPARDSLAAIGLAELRVGPPKGDSTHWIGVELSQSTGPLILWIQTRNPWRMRRAIDSVLPISNGGTTAPLVLQPGEKVRLQVETVGSSQQDEQ